MTESKGLPKFVRVGASAPKPKAEGEGKGKGIFWSAPADEKVQVHVLVGKEQIISVEQCALWNHFNPSPVWTFIGDDDPSHQLGIRPGYRAFLPVAVKIDGETKIKLWSMSITCHRQIESIADTLAAGVKGQVLSIHRTGKGKTTKFNIIPIGKKIRVDDSIVPTEDQLIELLGPYDRGEIIKLIETITKIPFDQACQEVRAKLGGAVAKLKPGGKAERVAIVEEITLGDDDEVEDIETAADDDGEF